MTDLSQLFLYIPGIVIFLVGSGQVRERNRTRKSGNSAENGDEVLFHPWMMMVEGALLIILALEQNLGRQVQAMFCLALVLAGAGVSLIADYVSLKRRNLQVIDAEIVAIDSRQLSQETKIIRGAKFTYYPIVKYRLNNVEKTRKCNINSSGQHTFRTGEHMNLYYDPQSGAVLEKHARIGAAAAGVILTVIGLLAGASILPVLF